MRVLAACEWSGTVRKAFRNKGHDAWSCDILSALGGSPYHIKGDVLNVLNDGWDMMIAHPPCNHLAVSGALHFHKKLDQQKAALEFVQKLLDAPIKHICLENPVSIISSHIRKPDDIIQPYNFGHDASKTTCLWLKNLPKLERTKYIPPRIVERDGKKYKRWANQTDSGQNALGPSKNRSKLRAITYEGIAEAMASQYPSFIEVFNEIHP